ncbi:hypothetical protein SAMN05428964_101270 [Thalassospira xiamenensis]|uniref:Uncharacterized protein n=1 Tax=Thalassospira xiamenensis TaxID=220697 RepID=A0A285R995_9PROT|nr:hypothetical protein SAMN05428964_101270 [Thalassospira xiamenensis]
MDSGSALRFARNDDFDQPTNHSNQFNPAALCIDKMPPTGRTAPRTNARRSRLRQNAPHPTGNSIVARQAHLPPSMTGLSASSNAPSAHWQSIPLPLGIAKRYRPGRLDRTGLHQTDHAPVPAAPNKRLGLSMDTASAPRPKDEGALAGQGQIPPLMTSLSASPNDPSAPSPSLPIQPADPMQTQFGPADPRHCQTSPTGWVAAGWADLSPALAAPNKHPCPKGTSLPS